MASPFWAGLRSTVISGYRCRRERKKGICSQNGHGRKAWMDMGCWRAARAQRRSPRISCCLVFFREWRSHSVFGDKRHFNWGSWNSPSPLPYFERGEKGHSNLGTKNSGGTAFGNPRVLGRTRKMHLCVASTFFILRSPILIYDLLSFFGSL